MYRDSPPPIIWGKELRKIETMRYRVYTQQREEQADLPGRDHFRLISSKIKPWDLMVTTTPTIITNQVHRQTEEKIKDFNSRVMNLHGNKEMINLLWNDKNSSDETIKIIKKIKRTLQKEEQQLYKNGFICVFRELLRHISFL